jgi:hypothetical protein
MRDFQKIKELSDYNQLDHPEYVMETVPTFVPASESPMMVLRMLVRPKYGDFIIPAELSFLSQTIKTLADYDVERTGIKDSWCYVTIRHGEVKTKTDDQWHFDGSSFRTDIIPERNYVWVSNHPSEYKVGKLKFPKDFNPVEHNLFTFAEHQLKSKAVKQTQDKTWYLISPFCFHRRPNDIPENTIRTFLRICFTDIEGRDVNNTENPLLPTPFFGRNPVQSFRNKLKNYY